MADYIASVAGQDLPDEVATKTKCHLLDTFAAVISGAHLKAGRLATGFIATQGGTPEATVWGTDIRTTAINAALANGISGHADETDDSHLEGRFHPGCAVVPAALAVGEARSRIGQGGSERGGRGLRYRRAVLDGSGGFGASYGDPQHPQPRRAFRGLCGRVVADGI